MPTAEGKLPPSGGGESRCSPAGTRGDRTPSMVSCPLLTPLTFLCAATPFGRAAKRGLRGLGSGRRFAFGTLLCPEFSLRYPPRIPVRGQTVQGGGGTLRKAPLPSRMCPWSTKRHCGPLAFRRATEGSRGLKEGLGESRGGKGTIRCPCPLLPLSVGTDNPPAAGRRLSRAAEGGNFSPAVGTAINQRSGFHRSFAVFAHSMPFSVRLTSCFCKSE